MGNSKLAPVVREFKIPQYYEIAINCYKPFNLNYMKFLIPTLIVFFCSCKNNGLKPGRTEKDTGFSGHYQRTSNGGSFKKGGNGKKYSFN